MSTIAPTMENGSKMRSVPRTRSTQKLPSSPDRGAGEPAHQRDGHRHPDGGGHEVLHRQTGHLHEMALRRFAGVGLPVGVGDEADRGVPRQRGRQLGGRVVQVQRQRVLDQLQDEQEQNADRRERQHASGIGPPRLFGARINADQPVDHSLDGRILFRGVHPIHVVAQAAHARPPARITSTARKMTPAVVVLTRTSPGTAARPPR